MSRTTYQVSEISASSPDMSEEEFTSLVDDIREHGQLVPIVKHGNEIIDGRKRLLACTLLGIEPRTVDVSPDQDPAALANSLNIMRTHYTPSQRAMFAAKRAKYPRGDVKAAIRKNPDGQTVEQAAKLAGVDASYVHSAKRIQKGAAPEIVHAIEAGRLTLHSAEQIVKAVPKSDQPAAVERVLKASRGKARHTPASALVAKKKAGQPSGRRTRPQPKYHASLLLIEEARNMLVFAAQNTNTGHFKASLMDAVKQLSRIAREMKSERGAV